jgi:hypothetical protein
MLRTKERSVALRLWILTAQARTFSRHPIFGGVVTSAQPQPVSLQKLIGLEARRSALAVVRRAEHAEQLDQFMERVVVEPRQARTSALWPAWHPWRMGWD